MGLRVAFQQEIEAIPVPYPPVDDYIRNNRGFMDLRGRPADAARIPETAASPALLRLLVRLAELNAPLFSLGCDLGSHEETNVARKRRHVAGGYIQVAAAKYDQVTPDAYHAFANIIKSKLNRPSEVHIWEVVFILQGVEFRFYLRRRGYARRCGPGFMRSPIDLIVP